MTARTSKAGGVALFGVIVGLAMLAAGPARAQNVVDQVITQYQSAATSWVAPLEHYAMSLFWLLAGIEFTWSMFSLAFRGADLAELFAELFKQFMVIWIFIVFVQQSSQIAGYIISSFTQAAQVAGTQGSSPGNILATGVTMAGQILNLTPIPGMSLNVGAMAAGYGTVILDALLALCVLICMAIIAARAAMINIEAYIVVASMTLLVGFGGSRWTRDYAMRALSYAMSVGGKLFMLNLIAGTGTTIIQAQTAQVASGNQNSLMLLLGVIIVFLALVLELPNLMQSLLLGSAVGSGSGLMGAGAAAGGTALAGAGVAESVMKSAGTAAMAGAGGLNAVKTAYQLSRGESASATFLGTIDRMSAAMKSDIGGRLSGTVMNRGLMGFRMAHKMRETDSAGSAPSPKRGSAQAPPNPSACPTASPTPPNAFSAGGEKDGAG